MDLGHYRVFRIRDDETVHPLMRHRLFLCTQRDYAQLDQPCAGQLLFWEHKYNAYVKRDSLETLTPQTEAAALYLALSGGAAALNARLKLTVAGIGCVRLLSNATTLLRWALQPEQQADELFDYQTLAELLACMANPQDVAKKNQLVKVWHQAANACRHLANVENEFFGLS